VTLRSPHVGGRNVAVVAQKSFPRSCLVVAFV
jgi:hypothetical protein